jgi:hypothetical protein
MPSGPCTSRNNSRLSRRLSSRTGQRSWFGFCIKLRVWRLSHIARPRGWPSAPIYFVHGNTDLDRVTPLSRHSRIPSPGGIGIPSVSPLPAPPVVMNCLSALRNPFWWITRCSSPVSNEFTHIPYRLFLLSFRTQPNVMRNARSSHHFPYSVTLDNQGEMISCLPTRAPGHKTGDREHYYGMNARFMSLSGFIWRP